MIRILEPGDEHRLDRFLQQHADSSLFLRSNVLAAGLRDEGKALQATYVAILDEDEITAVVAHCWNGNLLLQAPVEASELARRALTVTGRAVAGIIGPWQQVAVILNDLALQEIQTSMSSREDLFALSMDGLRVPSALERGTLTCRRADPDDLELLADWRRSYRIEALGELDLPELLASCRDDVARGHGSGSLFVLTEQGRPVSTCAFNARHPECVQIGAVWTPPQLRSHGYGRSVVAGALLLARAEGVTRSVLFTGEDNVAARTAYVSLGYRRVGDYGLVLFRDPQRVEGSSSELSPSHRSGTSTSIRIK